MSTTELPLVVTAVRPTTWTTRIVLVISGAGLIALCAQIAVPLPFTPVPITGQTFAVLLVGSSLGLGMGVTSTALYVVAGIAGAPVYADGAHGWEQFTSASGGYLIGFVLASGITGALAQRGWDRRFGTATASMLAGNVIVYLAGVPWLAAVLDTDIEKSFEYGLYPFVVGDILKLYLAAVTLPAAWRVVRAFGRGRR